MTRLLMIRHAATSWNRNTRIQGLSDIPIDAEAREEASKWCLPAGFDDADWYSSPLVRATETAHLLGESPKMDERLIEMNWGDWEGDTLENLRRILGEDMTRNENQGLDFRPPGGESPRDLQERLHPWLGEIARAGNPAVAVTHKGIIRAIMALATGWDMMGKPPSRVLNAAGHIFALDDRGNPIVEELNIPLVPGGKEG